MTSNHVGHLITSTIITLQHFAALHHTSPNYTSLHLSTLYFLSFTLHYFPIWLNSSTFPIVLFHLTQYRSHIPKLISKIMIPFTALKDLSPFHFTSLCIVILYIFFHLLYKPFTCLALPRKVTDGGKETQG
jgi:Na+/H+ antiporter NhaD/arsenite permease-like protein